MGGCYSKSKYTMGDDAPTKKAKKDKKKTEASNDVKVEHNANLNASPHKSLDVNNIPFIDKCEGTLGDRSSILHEDEVVDRRVKGEDTEDIKTEMKVVVSTPEKKEKKKDKKVKKTVDESDAKSKKPEEEEAVAEQVPLTAAEPEKKKKKSKNYLDQFRDDNEIHAVDFMRIFQQYDKDKSGYLDAGELRGFLKDLLKSKGEKANAETVEVYLDQLLEESDIDQDSRIELGELSLILPVEKNFLTKFPRRETRPKEELDAIFAHYDKDGSGTIGGEELLALLRDMFQQEGQMISNDDLEEYAAMVREIYDIGEDGTLGKADITLLLTKY